MLKEFAEGFGIRGGEYVEGELDENENDKTMARTNSDGSNDGARLYMYVCVCCVRVCNTKVYVTIRVFIIWQCKAYRVLKTRIRCNK